MKVSTCKYERAICITEISGHWIKKKLYYITGEHVNNDPENVTWLPSVC